MKKLLFKLINKYFLNLFGFEISRRNDTSVSQLKGLFKNKRNLKIIDCGAFEGDFTNDFQNIYKDSEFICIEPSPKSFKLLSKKFKSNNNISLENTGLYSSIKEGVLKINTSEKTNSILNMDELIPNVQRKFHQNKGEKIIKLVTLDFITKKYNWLDKSFPNIDLLKIDVQGAELDLLIGAEKTLHKTESILIEIHFIRSYEKSPLFYEINNFLLKRGFIFKRFYDLIHDPQDRTRLIYGDALFTRKEFLK